MAIVITPPKKCRLIKLTAAVFIIVGLLFLGRNFGIIDSDLFGILVSWQMLLIVVGVVNLIKRHFFGGVITIAIGAYFLLPEISWVEGEWLDMFWPVLFIFVGIMILFKPERHHFNAHWDGRRPEYTKEVYGSEDGFIVSDNTFGSVQQIVLDPVFRGARLRNAFGGTVLDLRRSKLEAPQTFIDIDCTFGGVEIYLPSDWNLLTQIDAFIGGCDDKRYNSSLEIDKEHIIQATTDRVIPITRLMTDPINGCVCINQLLNSIPPKETFPLTIKMCSLSISPDVYRYRLYFWRGRDLFAVGLEFADAD